MSDQEIRDKGQDEVKRRLDEEDAEGQVKRPKLDGDDSIAL